MQTPSSAELGRYPGLPFPASQYVPPQPSIEEARQTMHSLLDDAFALVAPSSQPPNAAAAGPGLPAGLPVNSTPSGEERRTTQWGSFYSPAQTANNPCSVSVDLLEFSRGREVGALLPDCLMCRIPAILWLDLVRESLDDESSLVLCSPKLSLRC